MIFVLQVSSALRKLLQFSGGKDACFVYTGDFNSEPTHTPYCYLKDGYCSEDVLTKNPDKEDIALPTGGVRISLRLGKVRC